MNSFSQNLNKSRNHLKNKANMQTLGKSREQFLKNNIKGVESKVSNIPFFNYTS